MINITNQFQIALWATNVHQHMPIYLWVTKIHLPILKDKCIIYHRFIDDIFLIWTVSKEELQTFLHDINEVHNSIKFESTYSKEYVHFLHTTVFFNKDQVLSNKLYTKPTDCQNYLHYNLYHPKAQKDNIPLGQALRGKRIRKDTEDLVQSLETLKTGFVSRGYQEEYINTEFKKIDNYRRNELLTYKSKRKKLKKLTCSVDYNRNLPNIKAYIKKNWNILHLNKTISDKFPAEPTIAFRRNRNLKNIIGQTYLSKNKKVLKRNPIIGKCNQCLSKSNNLCCRQTTGCPNKNGTRN